jgi:NAD+ synthase
MSHNPLPAINPGLEAKKIDDFFRNVVNKTGIRDVVIGWSGGVDSTVALYLLPRVYEPSRIHVLHMPYETDRRNGLAPILEANRIPSHNAHVVELRPLVDSVWERLAKTTPPDQKNGAVRKGNIMARMRMVTLFDFARAKGALVCGTENKSEHFLGYFTRFGDAASDMEPIEHLYKTQVYEMAAFLGLPREIVQRKPSADLWDGQTDEGEFGFTYDEADRVLSLYFDQHVPLKEIEKLGLVRAQEILGYVERNLFKHKTPYRLVPEFTQR